MTQFWFILSIFFIILELINPGLFFFLALSLGATITLLTQLFDVSWISEYAIFFASTTVMFALLQIKIKRMQKKKTLSYVSRFCEPNYLSHISVPTK